MPGCEGQEIPSVPSPPIEKDTKEEKAKKEKLEAQERQEGVKTEVCLSEEGKGKDAEQWVEVWEKDLNTGGIARDFQVVTGVRRREKEEAKVKDVKSLIGNFPNLKVGGLLPEPDSEA